MKARNVRGVLPHRRPGALAGALRRQEERHALALALAAEWPGGLPWDLWGVSNGALVGLERKGLVERLPGVDRIGAVRFVLTAAGRAAS